MQELPIEEKEFNPLDDYQTTLNTYLKAINNFTGSKSQLQNVLAAIALQPLNQNFNFGYPDQEALYELGVKVESAKLLFLYSSMEIKKQELAEQNNKKENDNGSEQTPQN